MSKAEKLEALKDRILLELLIKKPSGCWEWQGNCAGKDRMRYGFMWLSGRRVNVRRVVYVLWKLKPKLGDYAVASICRNPLCCNPEHLHRSKRRKGGLRKVEGYDLLKGV